MKQNEEYTALNEVEVSGGILYDDIVLESKSK